MIHACRWPGCEKEVQPRLWGCYAHWMRLPITLRNELWRHYRPGQEVDKHPSPEYVRAEQAIQAWIVELKAKQAAEDERLAPQIKMVLEQAALEKNRRKQYRYRR